MMERWQKMFLGAGVAVLLVLWLGIYAETKECEAKGGKRLRGMLLESFKCYDAASLKVLP
jgi:hypothetical protein